ncbi:lipoate--protein ligase [Alkalitalea saponilacus]|uniref:lipoate--protein ligase n=1 Tax=Alkalitalea saponilacus TaxID=889453 RepID=A0A1T5E9Z8_9BACT|nr:lipoate--protein ligase [Alkalitalea saponilacus]ASB49066.1 lipoate--protein ligase [Alkalitalea saponilacus]SKB80686.1 lipoate-protein ligase A [Alkalitalea saponilacus]
MNTNTLSIISKSKDPAFNLATEEYLLRQKTENIHFFYINRPSVIIGKHQNALAEINLNYLQREGIPLFRRLSGGGTVYHDEGNINFCFIKNGEHNDLVNFKKATDPIVTVLNDWGIPVRHGVRNDLLIDYKKISGNACHVFKRRVMHHGTLLFNSNLEHLTFSLKSDPGKFRDKAVKSVRSEVMNISAIYNEAIEASDFLNKLESQIRFNNSNTVLYDLTYKEIDEINKLKKEKYDTTEWNYSYGPAYEFSKRVRLKKAVFSVKMKVEKGKIRDLQIRSTKENEELCKLITKNLIEIYHQKEAISHALTQNLSITEFEVSEITDLFF